MRKLALVLVLLASTPVVANAEPSPSPTPTTAGGATIAMPPPPPVSDPMLAPAPAPKRVLSSWAEGVSYLRARSTDLKITLDQVLQAEAATRIALAQYLPWINANNAGGAVY